MNPAQPPSQPPPTVMPAPALVTRRCQHQNAHFPCPWQSCPAGVAGKRLRLMLLRADGSKYPAYFRRRLKATAEGVVFEWTPA